MMDSHGILCLDADLGLGIDYIDPKLRVRRKSLRKNVISQKIKLDNLGEELRILYVAMTRAKEKLILTGVTKKPPQLDDTEKNRLSFLKLAETGNFLDLLLPLINSKQAADIFSTTVWTPDDLISETVNEIIGMNQRQDELIASLSSDNDLLKEKVTQVSEKFAKPYPHANLKALYAKTTVSELKKASLMTGVINVDGDITADIFNQPLFEEPEVIPYLPEFMKEEAKGGADLSGSARGSAYHKVMEIIDFSRLNGEKASEIEAEVLAQIEEALGSGRLSAEDKKAVPMAKVLAFFLSTLAKRLINAGKAGRLYKEQPFIAGISANRINKDLPPDETILMQGIIDVFFEEHDGLVILDYKSDAVTSKEELITRYEKQLGYYQEALTQLTGKPVKEKIIYSFALNDVIVLDK